MLDTRWFISFKILNPETGIAQHDTVITDITPARWFLHRKTATFLNHYILYAEEISPVLAAELAHLAKIQTDYYKEVDNADL